MWNMQIKFDSMLAIGNRLQVFEHEIHYQGEENSEQACCVGQIKGRKIASVLCRTAVPWQEHYGNTVWDKNADGVCEIDMGGARKGSEKGGKGRRIYFLPKAPRDY